MLVGTTTRVLQRAIDIPLEVTPTVSWLLHLEVNFRSEAILRCKGKMGNQNRQMWKQPNGKLAVPLDDYGDRSISGDMLYCCPSASNVIDHIVRQFLGFLRSVV